MKDRKVLLLLIGLALTGLTVFLGCDTGDPDPKPSPAQPQTPQTDPVPRDFVGKWKNADPAHSDWQMEISDSKFTFSGTVHEVGGLVVAAGDLGKIRGSEKYSIKATEVNVAGSLYPVEALGPLSGVDMTVDGNSLKIKPPDGSQHIMAMFIGGTYTKQQ